MKKTSSLRRFAGVVLIAALGLWLAAAPGNMTFGAFSFGTSNSSNSFTSAADWVSPSIARSIISKTSGYLGGSIKPGATYQVFAEVADTGNPASGTSSVTANVSAITTGSTSVALSTAGGPFVVSGLSYSHKSASLVANAGLSLGSKTYTVSASDTAGNNSGAQSYTVMVETTKPSASDVQAVNGGVQVSLAELSDTLTLTFSEPIDPFSVLAGWDGLITNVVVRITQQSGQNDVLTIRNAANTANLPLGSLDLGRNDYTAATISFGATGTASKMALSGSVLTVVLGTPSGGTTLAAGTGTIVWTPNAAVYDAAGNTMSTTARNELGAADRDF